MDKISYEQYLTMLHDIDTAEEEILAYSKIESGTGFDVQLLPDPERVDLSESQMELENAMKIGNGIARWRRRSRFNRRIKDENKPVLVSEGDSWFQFPFLVNDIIDQLGDDYLIWSVGAAGDTAENMVFNRVGQGRTEYMRALRRQKDNDVKGFLFSAAGNDIIGEDPDTGEPVLKALLRPFNGNPNNIEGHINLELFDSKLGFLREAYQTVIDSVRADGDFADMPIFIHGYDYVFPYQWGDNDERDPKHTSKKKWLAPPLDDRGIFDLDLRRNVIKFMLDRLYDMLADIAGDPTQSNVWLVDCRGAMPEVSDWIDEIHGTSAGFAKVAERFRIVLANAGL